MTLTHKQAREDVKRGAAWLDATFGEGWHKNVTRPVVIDSNVDCVIAQVTGRPVHANVYYNELYVDSPGLVKSDRYVLSSLTDHGFNPRLSKEDLIVLNNAWNSEIRDRR